MPIRQAAKEKDNALIAVASSERKASMFTFGMSPNNSSVPDTDGSHHGTQHIHWLETGVVSVRYVSEGQGTQGTLHSSHSMSSVHQRI